MKLLDALCGKKEGEHEEGGDLLLDTEIWDLILLESGDVEINPGPLTSRLMSISCSVHKLKVVYVQSCLCRGSA